ncbi:hypothetical protein ACKVV1_008127 [Pyricularia oryzae]
MATAILGRRALAQRCVPLALGASLGIGHFAYRSKTQPYRLDALSSRSASTWSPTTGGVLEIEEEDGFIDSDVLRQVSGGSVTGFLSGVFVSVFSRTLVLLMGLTIVAFSVAAKYGIDLVHQLRLKERAQSSRVLSALRSNTPFKLSFGVTFALSAFAHF